MREYTKLFDSKKVLFEIMIEKIKDYPPIFRSSMLFSSISWIIIRKQDFFPEEWYDIVDLNIYRVPSLQYLAYKQTVIAKYM